ncbi:MAG: BACON domain-containing protein [Muribaculaceae bacterium]|nr:BACON domain-containing protein [Muribaculaceae bacterium]
MKRLITFSLSLALLALPMMAKNDVLDAANAMYSSAKSIADYQAAKKKFLSAKTAVGYTAADEKAITNGIRKCDNAINNIRGANMKSLPEYSKPTPSAAPSLTVNGSASPSISLSSEGSSREVTIATNQGQPFAYDLPGWIYISDITPTSMHLMWDANNSPNPRSDSFKVTAGAKTITVNVSQPKGIPNVLQITGVKFANTRGQAILTDFGEKLFADEMRFLTAEITYNGPKTMTSKTVNVKVFNPNGTLRTTPYSPQGFTYSSEIDFEPGWAQSDYLKSVGHSSASTFDAGLYKIELYVEDELVHTENLYINAKDGSTTYLTLNNQEHCDTYFLAQGESREITVRTDGDWTTMDLPEWCKAYRQGDSLILTAEYNQAASPRDGYMTVVSGNRRVNVRLHQEGNYK